MQTLIWGGRLCARDAGLKDAGGQSPESVEGLSLTPSASLGFGGNAWTDCGTELTDQTVGLAAAYALCENVTLGAQINYTWIPSHELRRADYMGEGKDQLLWGGVNVTFSF